MFEIYIENKNNNYQILTLQESYENFKNIKTINRVYFKNKKGQFFDFDEITKELTTIINQKDNIRFSKVINILIDFNNSELGRWINNLYNGFDILKTDTIKNNYHLTTNGDTKEITLLEIKQLSVAKKNHPSPITHQPSTLSP